MGPGTEMKIPSLYVDKSNNACAARSRRINFPVNFQISFASFSIYNARTGSETHLMLSRIIKQ